MNRIMNYWIRTSVCLPLLVAGLFSQAPVLEATAQDVLEDLYGAGVHAYFAGNTVAAEERFNEAITAGSQDPRVYYFRGLSQIRSQGGSVDAGAADFEQGAQLEVLGKRSGDIPRSLTRIQGPARMAIESARSKARLESKSKQFELIRKRYEAAAASGVIPNTSSSASPVKPGPNATDPFTGDAALSKGTPTPMPKAKEAAADDTGPKDPFGDDPAATPATEAAAPAADDPFGTPGAEPAAADDPFGGN